MKLLQDRLIVSFLLTESQSYEVRGDAYSYSKWMFDGCVLLKMCQSKDEHVYDLTRNGWSLTLEGFTIRQAEGNAIPSTESLLSSSTKLACRAVL